MILLEKQQIFVFSHFGIRFLYNNYQATLYTYFYIIMNSNLLTTVFVDQNDPILLAIVVWTKSIYMQLCK